MVVILAPKLPPRSRGFLKSWFLEVKPGVFVSGIAKSLASDVLTTMVARQALEGGCTVFFSMKTPPGMEILHLGTADETIGYVDGLPITHC